MSNDVTKWIAEIKALREQLAEAQRDRDAALDSAAQWSQLYNREAEQRRTETKASQRTIESLKREIDHLKANLLENPDEAVDLSTISTKVKQINTVEELQQKLIEALSDRDRLVEAFKAEQMSHARTRQSLTTALGDTIDLLTKHREGVQLEEVPANKAIPAKPQPARLPEPPAQPAPLPFKTPSLRLPPTRPAPPRS